MINAWLGHIQALMILVFGLFAVYMVVRIVSVIEIQKNKDKINAEKLQPKSKQKKLINVEIKSRDLAIKAENLIDQSDIYGLQIDQCVREIAEIDVEIEQIRNPIPKLTHDRKLDLSNPAVKELVNKSLRLQERKAKLEEKLIKIHAELDKIAMEEYKRQTA